MRTLCKRFGFPVLLAALALVVISCEVPTQYQGTLIEPQVTKVAVDGKTCEVNVGAIDGVRPGKQLWVVRGNEVVAILGVLNLRDYSADCIVNRSPNTLLKAKAGDRVSRDFKEVLRPGSLRSRVPRMVPVPHADNTITINTGIYTDPPNLVITVPRDQYEEWKKKYNGGP